MISCNVIDHTNYYRSLHGVDNLIYSQEITTSSETWAKYLAENNIFEHDLNTPYGENLAAFSLSNNNDDYFYKKSVDAWYEEIKFYDYNNPVFAFDTGHFTQLIWKNSQYIGCGLAKGNTWVYVVCRYDPQGNMFGAFEENVLPLVSSLPPPPRLSPPFTPPPEVSLSPPPPCNDKNTTPSIRPSPPIPYNDKNITFPPFDDKPPEVSLPPPEVSLPPPEVSLPPPEVSLPPPESILYPIPFPPSPSPSPPCNDKNATPPIPYNDKNITFPPFDDKPPEVSLPPPEVSLPPSPPPPPSPTISSHFFIVKIPKDYNNVQCDTIDNIFNTNSIYVCECHQVLKSTTGIYYRLNSHINDLNYLKLKIPSVINLFPRETTIALQNSEKVILRVTSRYL